MRNLLIICVLLLCGSQIKGQVNQSAEQIIGDLMESISEREVDLNNQSQVFDDLLEMYENPVNVNSISKKELEKLVFLSDMQILNILNFVERNGPISSKYQLLGVKGLTRLEIESLLYFVSIKEQDKKSETKKYLNGQWIIRDQFDLEKAKGYQNDSIEGSGYLGNRHHLYSRLKMQYGNSIYAGITVDNDPGEVVFKENYQPIDFVSMHLMYEGKGFFKQVIVGDYHANFGQGLALWSGTGMGKTSEVLQTKKRSEGFRKYTSANEYSFFRGIAATMELADFSLSVFASTKKRDANLLLDSLSAQYIITSLPETGYHRTSSELEKRNQLQQYTFGANLQYTGERFLISGGGYYHKFSADSMESKELYNKLSLPKVKSSHYWLSYQYGVKRLIGFGELASDVRGNAAIINGLNFNPTNNVSVALSHRYFAKRYYSIWTNAFSEYSAPSGESGFYMGLIVLPVTGVKISGYLDVFDTSWLKYNLDKPSNGYELSLQGDYKFKDQFTFYIRYREKEKYKNHGLPSLSDYSTVRANTKKIRLHSTFDVDQNWGLQLRVEKSFYTEVCESETKGTLAFGGIKFLSNNSKLACWARYTVFDTESYETRIYAYENDLLYNFYTPSFQGEGSRVYFQVRYMLFKKVKLWCKIAQTWYADKESFGSGMQAIKGNTRTNIKMQLQYKF